MGTSTSSGESLYKVKTKGIDAINSDSDDDHDPSTRVLLPRSKSLDQFRPKSLGQFRSKSVYLHRRRGEKVRSVSTREKKVDEAQKVVPESKPRPQEEKVGDIVRFGRNSYFVVDIFEKEIMELGDKVDLNFKRFNKFEAVDARAPMDHHFYRYRCCYSCCCVCVSSTVESELEKLKTELEKKDGSSGVSFFVRTYNERKELMRVAVTDQSHSLFFFDVKFPIEYPHQAPYLFYHPYGLPLSNFETQLRAKRHYNMLDVFDRIEEVVMSNTTNKSCHQMLDMLKRPLNGFEDFVKGHFRKKGAFILRNMMEEMDLEKERDKNMFFKTYVAFEDNKSYCEHLLNSDLKKELERYKEKECSLCDHYYSSSSSYFQPITSRFDDIQKTSRYKNILSKIFLF